MNIGNPVLVHYTKVDSLLQFVSSRLEKESMKVESTVLDGQRETCHEKKEQTETLTFLSWFSVVLTCLLAGFVFTSSCLVCGSFSGSHPKMGTEIFV